MTGVIQFQNDSKMGEQGVGAGILEFKPRTDVLQTETVAFQFCVTEVVTAPSR